MEDVMMNEVAKDSESSSVRALAVAPTDPPHHPWPVYDPTYVSHEPIPDKSPSYDGFLPSAQQKSSALYVPWLSYANTSPSEALCYSPYTGSYTCKPAAPHYAPTPPGQMNDTGGGMVYGTLEEQALKGTCREDIGVFGRIGLHCYNLQKGTNFQYSGLHDSKHTGIYSHIITVVAKDPIRNSSCKVASGVSHTRDKDCLSVQTGRCRIVSPAPDDDYMGPYEGNHEAELGMPDKWLPEDALTGSNKLQYYEMKESEVEQEKEWLLLYAEFALFAGFRVFSKEVVELEKVIVQTREGVESKVKAKNAIFYISFNLAGYGHVTCNAIVMRSTDGRPGRFTHKAKCFKEYH